MAGPVVRTRPSFRFFSLEAPLARYVAYLYASDVPKHFLDQIVAVRLPELEAQLVFAIEEGRAFPGAVPYADGLSASLFLQPAHLQVIPIPGTIRAAVGASLKPAGLRLLLRRGAGDLSTEPVIPLEALWGRSARDLLEKLMEAKGQPERLAILAADLEARARRAGRTHVSAAHAVDLLRKTNGDVSIEAVAERCGITSRTLHKVLLGETGLSPKQLARVARIRHALDLMRGGAPFDRSESLRAFADQAHMCREFRALLGTTPMSLARDTSASKRVPSFTTERDLVGTGLLIRPL